MAHSSSNLSFLAPFAPFVRAFAFIGGLAACLGAPALQGKIVDEAPAVTLAIPSLDGGTVVAGPRPSARIDRTRSLDQPRGDREQPIAPRRESPRDPRILVAAR